MKFGPKQLLFLFLLLHLPGAGFAEESRLALVIGNSQYEDSPLQNPTNDATDMAAVLEELGFTVLLHLDADRRGMGRAIREFGRKLKASGGVGLFYYAGHGMQIDDRNYLIPVDTQMAEEDEVPYESVDVGSVLAKMESAGNALNLIILDACRNNPFPARFRSSNRGLARVEAPIGSLVVYATAPGAVADDGDGRNGVFTGALIDQLRTDGLSLTQTIRRTRAAVVEATNGKQVPWESSSLLKDYYFTKKPEALARRSIDENANSAIAKRPDAPVKKPAETAAIMEAPPEQNATDEQQPARLAALTVNVVPADARIRIMDIIEQYKPGMSLDASRSYDVFITRKGYNSHRETITLDNDKTALNFTLTKKAITEPEMIPIAGGSFTMGCTKSDKQCEAYEKPARLVDISPYYISATEITVGQFKEFVSSTGYTTDAERNAGDNSGCFIWSDNGGISRSQAKWDWDDGKNWNNPGYRQTDSHPVTCVSWNDANNYAQWISSLTNRLYELPSESEWELAARAVSDGIYGSSTSARDLCAVANVADNSQSPSGSKWASRINCTDNHWFSAPVASYQANSFGLFDMQGNAWEWVADAWSDNMSTVPDNGMPYVGNPDNNDRVLRGGGWDSDASRTRLSSRGKGQISSRASMTGFRLVIRRESQ